MDGGACGLRKQCPRSQGSRAPGGDRMGHVVKSQRRGCRQSGERGHGGGARSKLRRSKKELLGLKKRKSDRGGINSLSKGLSHLVEKRKNTEAGFSTECWRKIQWLKAEKKGL